MVNTIMSKKMVHTKQILLFQLMASCFYFGKDGALTRHQHTHSPPGTTNLVDAFSSHNRAYDSKKESFRVGRWVLDTKQLVSSSYYFGKW